MKIVWRLMTHYLPQHRAAALDWSVRNRRLAIGWGSIGNLSTTAYASREAIQRAIGQHYPNDNTAITGARSLFSFCREMAPGDLVILNTDRPALVMEVVGICEYGDPPNVPDMEHFRHQRSARIVGMDATQLWRAADGGPAEGTIYQALIRCNEPISRVVEAELLQQG
jgi:hypothetical protein